MSNGGAEEKDDVTGTEKTPHPERTEKKPEPERAEKTSRPEPTAAPRRRRALASAVGLVLVAGGVAVPFALGVGDDTCKQLPAGIRALAKDPAAATRALDPRDDMSRYDAVRALLPSGTLCGDGGRALGRVVDAATGADAVGTVHSTAQARAMYAVSAVYDGAPVPPGAEPGLARALAGYVADTTGFVVEDPDAATPAASGADAAPDEAGFSRFGRFLAPGEAHPEFGFDHTGTVTADPARLFGEVAKDPEAFAILYDAERAYLAHYLERLTAQGTDPDQHPEKEPGEARMPPTLGPDNDLQDIARRVGTLMYVRADGARDGGIDDLYAFDEAVLRHTRGAYRAAADRVTLRPPMNGIARRPVSGAVRGHLMDGRGQLFLTLDAWAKARKVPAGRASAVRQVLDDAYLKGFHYGAS
ncbi:hypothetical protein [Streptomyces alanosinicus]|uniref:Uncharacterized protein n=1 Tax=Streptomyces alanosinicus TaxID=68171 RepID=A0A918YGL9_9ACTN|nr:hypothetical protein [Streptomyces alanosinicus]GHE03035.1 hypothetical protein GCM10010339_28720 [Streptomyces alanosinicus]